MKWTVFVGCLVLCVGFCSHSHGINPPNLAGLGGDKSFDVPLDTGVPCIVKCDCIDTCGKPKYWKKVCKTYTKAVAADCGCSKKVCKMLITEVSYQLVLFPKHHSHGDLVCSCTQPPGHQICKPCGDCHYYKQKKCCSCQSGSCYRGGATLPSSDVTPPQFPAASPENAHGYLDVHTQRHLSGPATGYHKGILTDNVFSGLLTAI